MCLVCDGVEAIVNAVPNHKLTSVEGINLLSRLIARAKKRLWIRESNLLVWEDKLIINALGSFLDKDFEEMRLAFHKEDNKKDALDNFKRDRKEIWALLESHQEKIESGAIKIYWWNVGYQYKHHLMISDTDVCVESHNCDPERTCGPAHFFFNDNKYVEYWLQIFEDSLEPKRSSDKLERYESEEIFPCISNV